MNSSKQCHVYLVSEAYRVILLFRLLLTQYVLFTIFKNIFVSDGQSSTLSEELLIVCPWKSDVFSQ